MILTQPVPAKSTNYPPAQPWWGLRNTQTGLIMGEVFPSVDDFMPDGFLYTWCDTTLLTQESIFASRSFKPDQTRKYFVSFVVIDGMGSLAYLSRNIGLDLLTQPKAHYKQSESINLSIKACSPAIIDNAEIAMVLKDNKGGVFQIGIPGKTNLSPLTASKLSFKGPAPSTPGTYQLGFRLSLKGKTIETPSLIGQTIIIDK